MEGPSRRFVPRRVIAAAQAFVHVESASGIALLAAAIVALVWANSPWDGEYFRFWHRQVVVDTGLFRIDEDLRHWVNDGLMTLFFFVMGLEIKRELVHGELSDTRRAVLPAAAAVGGMAVPALIYVAFNAGGEGARGWGIPMATDIAFALGVLSLLGRRIPFGIKVFLLALAITDDIGAIVVIAVFYTASIDLDALIIAAGLLGAIVALNRAGLRNVDAYVVLGAALWIALLESGVHATLAGVALGLLTPARAYYARESFASAVEELLARFRTANAARNEDEQQDLLGQIEDLSHDTESPLDRLERALHPWVSFGVVPLFALANAGVHFSSDIVRGALDSPVSLGVVLGLVLGKPLGIFSMTWLAVRLRLSSLPHGVSWSHVVAVGLLGGIGFTVSLLVTDLASDTQALADDAKLGVLCASTLAGVLGLAFLWSTSRPSSRPDAAGEP